MFKLVFSPDGTLISASAAPHCGYRTKIESTFKDGSLLDAWKGLKNMASINATVDVNRLRTSIERVNEQELPDSRTWLLKQHWGEHRDSPTLAGCSSDANRD